MPKEKFNSTRHQRSCQLHCHCFLCPSPRTSWSEIWWLWLAKECKSKSSIAMGESSLSTARAALRVSRMSCRRLLCQVDLRSAGTSRGGGDLGDEAIDAPKSETSDISLGLFGMLICAKQGGVVSAFVMCYLAFRDCCGTSQVVCCFPRLFGTSVEIMRRLWLW